MRYTQFLFFVLLNLSAQFGLIIPALAAENISLDEATTLASVSYTHLDVYKRQG